MPLDRLTQRAKSIIANVSEAENIPAGELLKEISNSSGMGTYLIKTVPDLQLKKRQKVNISRLVKEAFFQSIKFQHPYVGTEHLLLALLKLSSSKDEERVRTEILRMNIFPGTFKQAEFDEKSPLLNTYSTNLTHSMFRGTFDRIKRPEVTKMMTTLLQKNNFNVLIVGEAGVGKRALVELLAQKILSLEVPPLLLGYQVVELDLANFIASVFNKPGSMQSSIGNLVDEVKNLNRAIIYIKNLHNVFISTNAGVAVPVVYSFLKASLDSAGIRVVATMDSGLYDKLVADNNQLFEGFSILDLEEPNEEHTLSIMESHSKILEDFHNIKISKKLIKYAYDKVKDVNLDIKFPLKGVNILDKACAHEIMQQNIIPKGYKGLVDTSFNVADEIDDYLESGNYEKALKSREKLKKLEKKLLKDEGKMFFGMDFVLTETSVDVVVREELDDLDVDGIDIETLRQLDTSISGKIIGQNKAVETVAKSLIRASLGLRSKKRPVGSFLFLGPTGVGKTELAKVLAEEAFGSDSLIRLDMSDFGEKHTVARLVGAPPGYVGYGEGGELTSKIDRKPDSVVLFDEIEKAHPDVLNILLQILEEAELTDARGNRFDFSEAVIILTSNLGTEILHQGGIGFDDSLKDNSNVELRLKNNLKKILKPELINRFDEVVVFNRLGRRDQLKILNLMLTEIKDTLKKQSIQLKITAQAKRKLLELGYSDEYGARSLRRIVEREVLDRVAEVLLDKKISDDDLTIKVDVKDDSLFLQME